MHEPEQRRTGGPLAPGNPTDGVKPKFSARQYRWPYEYVGCTYCCMVTGQRYLGAIPHDGPARAPKFAVLAGHPTPKECAAVEDLHRCSNLLLNQFAAACSTERSFIRSTPATGHKPRALLLVGYPRKAARLLSSPSANTQGRLAIRWPPWRLASGAVVQLPMSLITARSQWGLSHADWRSIKDQQITPVPFRLGFSVFILGAGERVWTFDTASLWYAERQDCLRGTGRCYKGGHHSWVIQKARGSRLEPTTPTLVLPRQAVDPGVRYLYLMCAAHLSLRRGVLATDRRQHDSCLRTKLSASSATACLSMDEDDGWPHNLDATAGKANGAVGYDMAPDELCREATGGDGQVNAEALWSDGSINSHRRPRPPDSARQLPAAEGPEKCAPRKAQGDTGGRSTQLVRRSGEWRPGWAMSKLQTVPIPTRLVFFK
ncbi:hypothetical protein CCHR01_00010 [Colletotrichum chrysophilum]|uniref:Uncharacterized protein n=1 Tax=Colletotrichum chrysophilum TaxID=1836956 RepID=A0AAD9B1V3_9PEZI|nr:hypothetical protein CCHR01_00010 [Colletotrichum chrysophilum]